MLEKNNWIATGGLFGAVAASSCCILPVLLVSVGAGGIWIGKLTALAPYQPFFIVVTLGLLTWGHVVVYRRRQSVCDADTACAQPLANRFVTTVLWAATALVAAAIAFPFLVPWVLG